MAWGDNRFGQVSRAAIDTCLVEAKLTACATMPVPVVGLDRVSAVAAGLTHSLAITAERRVQAWSDNLAGQSGEAATETCISRVAASCSLRPVIVPGVEGAIAIAGGVHIAWPSWGTVACKPSVTNPNLASALLIRGHIRVP